MKTSKVALGIPLYGYVPAYVYWRHITGILRAYAQDREIAGLLASEDCYLPWARRDLVLQAQGYTHKQGRWVKDPVDPGFTHLFFLDQDVIIPPGTIRKLVEQDRDVVGALYYQKVRGHAPVAGRADPNDPLGWVPLDTLKDAPMRVDIIGLGATLVNMKVFRELEDQSDDPDEGAGMGWFDMNARSGEDIEFCRRVREAGFTIYADPTIRTEHVGATPVTRDYRGVGI